MPNQPVLAEILGPDLLIILAIVALLFGGSRLPHLARSLGSAKREFERGAEEGRTETASEEQVTLPRSELDALIAEREAKGRAERPPPAT